MTRLALINEQTMVCENITFDDRAASEIRIAGYIVLDLDSVPTEYWQRDEQTNELVKVDGVIGSGGIGFTYENGKLVEPMPPEQPQTSGTQEL